MLVIPVNQWHCKKEGPKSSQQAEAVDLTRWTGNSFSIKISIFLHNPFCAPISNSIFSFLKLNPVPKFVILLFFLYRILFTHQKSSLDSVNLPNLYLIFLLPLYSKILPREKISKCAEQFLCVRHWANNWSRVFHLFSKHFDVMVINSIPISYMKQ